MPALLVNQSDGNADVGPGPEATLQCVTYCFAHRFFFAVLTNTDGAFSATSARPLTDATSIMWIPKYPRHSGCGIPICWHQVSGLAKQGQTVV